MLRGAVFDQRKCPGKMRPVLDAIVLGIPEQVSSIAWWERAEPDGLLAGGKAVHMLEKIFRPYVISIEYCFEKICRRSKLLLILLFVFFLFTMAISAVFISATTGIPEINFIVATILSPYILLVGKIFDR